MILKRNPTGWLGESAVCGEEDYLIATDVIGGGPMREKRDRDDSTAYVFRQTDGWQDSCECKQPFSLVTVTISLWCCCCNKVRSLAFLYSQESVLSMCVRVMIDCVGLSSRSPTLFHSPEHCNLIFLLSQPVIASLNPLLLSVETYGLRPHRRCLFD